MNCNLLTRNCPVCGNNIKYCNKYNLKYAELDNRKCSACCKIKYNILPPYIRKCLECNVKIKYSDKYHMIWANNQKSLCMSCTFSGKGNSFYGKFHSDESKRKMGAALLDYRNEKNPNWQGKKLLKSDFKKYYLDVISTTNRQPLQLLENYEYRGRAGINGAFHLDHIYPISRGFENNIASKIIGNIDNLQMLPWKENILKSNNIETDEG